MSKKWTDFYYMKMSNLWQVQCEQDAVLAIVAFRQAHAAQYYIASSTQSYEPVRLSQRTCSGDSSFNSQKKRFFFFSSVPTAHSASYPSSISILFPKGKTAGAWNEITRLHLVLRLIWNYTSTVWSFIKHRNKFTTTAMSMIRKHYREGVYK
jgi:hypothetical protein